MAEHVRLDVEEGFTRGQVDPIREAIHERNAPALKAAVEGLHPADFADLLEQISLEERRELLSLVGEEIDGDVLSEISDAIREEVIGALPPALVAEAVRDLETDDVVDILEDLNQPAQAAILNALESADRAAVEQAMSYPEYSAGRLMQREVVIAPEHWTVGEVIDFIRNAKWLPDQFYHVILVDPRMHPVAYVTLGRILSARRDTRMDQIVEDSFRTVTATDAEADVAYLFNQYHLISCPVVDENGRLVGVVTIDDAMNVLDEEHEEDMLRLAGVHDDASVADGVWETLKGRFPWLAVNLVTANVAAFVISMFDKTIAEAVVLAALMPIVASMGGNAGTQSLTVAVRALATRDLTSANAWRVVRREAMVGLCNDGLFALVMGTAAATLFGWPMLGVVIGMALVINLLVAALAGVLVPLTMEKMGADPALASGTFVTTLTDVIGFFSFLGLATVILM